MDDFIGVYDGALSAEQCDAIRARFDAIDGTPSVPVGTGDGLAIGAGEAVGSEQLLEAECEFLGV